jgi:hypothetical protein
VAWEIVPIAVVLVGVGALVGRWWLLLVPIAAGLVYGLALLIRGGRGDSEPIVYAFAIAAWAAAIAFLLAVGVALRKLRL